MSRREQLECPGVAISVANQRKTPGDCVLQLAHYHAKTPCSLHGASAYFRHHSSFEIVCGSAFVNGYERTKLCHSAVGLYPSQPISRLAHTVIFPRIYWVLKLVPVLWVSTPLPPQRTAQHPLLSGNPIYCWAATKYASIKAFGKSKSRSQMRDRETAIVPTLPAGQVGRNVL